MPEGKAELASGWFGDLVPLMARMIAGADEWGTTLTVAGAEGEEQVSLRELLDDAASFAAALQARGVAPRDHVAVMGLTSRPVVAAVLGVWLAGAAVVVLPIPMRLRDAALMAEVARRQADAAGAALVLADDLVGGLVAAAPGRAPVVGLEQLLARAGSPSPSRLEAPAVELDDLAVLQLTSGATGDPKIARITHRQIAANHRSIVAAAAMEVGDEVVVSWLPLYHDMGLIGFLTLPLAGARRLVLASPDTFVLSPRSWMELVSRHRGTVTGGPSFAYALAARALGSAGDADLSSLRVAFNGSEPVAADIVDRFLEAGAARGLRPSAMMPVYGMAEATLMVTCPPPGVDPAWDLVDPAVLQETDHAAPATVAEDGRRLARLGPPVPGMSLRVVDQHGAEVGDRRVGEIELRGPAVTAGYLGRDDLTAAALRDGWFRTGDRGYLVDGSLVVCGRWKDLLIVGGRNIEPEEIERAVGSVEGIRAGNVIAFTLDEPGAPQRLVVVAETRTHDPGLSHEVGRIVRSSVGTWPDDVVLVDPSTLPKTSSGKLRRGVCRTSFLAGELEGSARRRSR